MDSSSSQALCDSKWSTRHLSRAPSQKLECGRRSFAACLHPTQTWQLSDQEQLNLRWHCGNIQGSCMHCATLYLTAAPLYVPRAEKDVGPRASSETFRLDNSVSSLGLHEATNRYRMQVERHGASPVMQRPPARAC